MYDLCKIDQLNILDRLSFAMILLIVLKVAKFS